jgi:hypothetical protein
MNWLKTILIVALLWPITVLAHEADELAGDSGNTTVGVLGYWDPDREESVGTLEWSSSDQLPYGLFWDGFIDITAPGDEIEELVDSTHHFLRTRLGKHLIGDQGLLLAGEFDDGGAIDDSVARLGGGWTFTGEDGAWLQPAFYPLNTEEGGSMKAAIQWYVPLGFINDKVFTDGFIDYHFTEEGDYVWVAEPQIGYHLTDNLDILIEFKWDEFRTDEYGTAIGVRVKF